MPYIVEGRRRELDQQHPPRPASAGELNYILTQMLRGYIGTSLNYARINEAIGALECAKLELYRRLAVPYENEKWAANGDVYLP